VTGEGAPSPEGSPGVEPVLEAAVLPVGQAAPTEGVLVAQEVDPGAIQTRKMIDQITQMVDSDAAVVSSLLEHWVQRCEAYRESG